MQPRMVELIITVLFFTFCIFLSWRLQRSSTKGEVSFLGAGRGIGFIVNGFAQFSGLVSAASFLGFLGVCCTLGWSFTTMAFGVGSTLGFIISMLVVSGPLRRYSELRGKFTLTNFLADRFGTATSLSSSIFILVLFPLYIVAQLIGGGLAGRYILGLDFNIAVVFVAAFYVGYVVWGGMLSASWVDFVQGVLMFSFMIGLSITAIVHFGGLGVMIPQALEAQPFFLSLHPKISPWTYFGICTATMLFVLSSPHTVMRLFVTRDVRQGRAALSLTAGLSLVFHLLGYLGVAAAALILFPKIENVDMTYIEVMNVLFPPVARGFAVAGILAAIMSTTDVILLAVGAEFSHNLYKKFLNNDADPKRTLMVMRVVMLAIGATTTILAILLHGNTTIGKIALILIGGSGSTFFVPLIAGIWWKRANGVGGFLSCVGGFVVFFILFLTGIMPQYSEVLAAVTASVLFMVFGSLLTAPPRIENVAFVEALHR